MVQLPPNGPVDTTDFCMGSPTGSPQQVVNYTGVNTSGILNSTLVPADLAQSVSYRVNTIEFKFFIDSSNVATGFLVNSLGSQNRARLDILFIPGFNFLQTTVMESSGTERVIVMGGVNLTPGEWYHYVLRKETTNYAVRVGRVGRNNLNATTTSDTFPYGGANGGFFGTVANGGTGSTIYLRPFKQTAFENANVGLMANSSGNNIGLIGGFADMRVWDEARSDAQISDLRDEFIEYAAGTDTATLLHSFRFNENAQDPLDIKDAGFNCSFTGQAWGSINNISTMDFPSYPFAAGPLDVVPPPETLTATAELTLTADLEKPPEILTATANLAVDAVVERIVSASITATPDIPDPGVMVLDGTQEIDLNQPFIANQDLDLAGTLDIPRTRTTTGTAELLADYDLDQVFLRTPTLSAFGELDVAAMQELAKSEILTAGQVLNTFETVDRIKGESVTATPELDIAVVQELGESPEVTVAAALQVDYVINEFATATFTANTNLQLDVVQELNKSATLTATAILTLDEADAVNVVMDPVIVLDVVHEIPASESVTGTAELTATPNLCIDFDETTTGTAELTATPLVDVPASETTTATAELTLVVVQELGKSESLVVTPITDAFPALEEDETLTATAEFTLNAMVVDGGGNDLSFSQTVPTIGGGPDFWWRLNEDGTGTIADEVGSADGTFINTGAQDAASLLLGDPDNTAVEFPLLNGGVGLQPYGEANSITTGQPVVGQPYSIIGFFNLDIDAVTTTRFVVHRENAYRVFVLNDGRIRFLANRATSGSDTVDSAADALNPVFAIEGETHFFCATWSSTNGMRLYVDGALVDEDNGATAGLINRAAGTTETRIGAFLPPGNVAGVRGVIDEVAWWDNYELTADDVLDLYEGAANSPAIVVNETETATAELTVDYTLEVSRSLSVDMDQDIDLDGEVVRDAGVDLFPAVLTVTLARCISANIDDESGVRADPIREAEELEVKDIWNQALILLGARRVDSISEQTREANIMRDVWDEFRIGLLTDHSWNGAETEALLSRFTDSDTVTEVSPVNTDRWQYAYALPSDYLRVLKVNGYAAETGRDRYKITTLSNDTGKKRVLLSNESKVYIEYVYDVGDNVDLLSAKTRRAMSAMLAAQVAPYFGKDPATVQALQAEADREMREARGVDGQEGFPQIFNPSSLIQSRIRR